MIDITDILKDKLYSTREVAEIMRVSKPEIYRWIKKGLISTKVPHNHYFHKYMFFINGYDVIRYLSKFNE